MTELKSENSILAGIILALVAIGAFALFGAIGLRTILGIIIFIFLPFYMIFRNFNFSREEKLLFSFFAAITIFPSLVYWLGFIVPFRISIFAVFAVLVVISYILKKLSKKK